MDSIHIDKLVFFAHHGVFPEEKSLGQKFIISMILHIDLSKVGETDQLTHGICYKSVIENALRLCTEKNFNTIEGAAEYLAYNLLCIYMDIITIEIKFEKPNAAIKALFDTICINIKRSRTDYTSLKSS